MARRQAQAGQTTARQAKLAALRAEEARKKRNMNLTMGAIGLVLVVIVAFIVVKVVSGSGSSTPSGGQASAKIVKAVSGVPTSVYNNIGTGSVDVQHGGGPQPISGGGSLTEGGKPKVLYVGAEYCPYCATERWAVVAALSRFGTFHNLGTTTSASNDVYPNTATLSFHGASYSSKYLSFAGYETTDRQHAPLDKLPSADNKVFQKYDAPPYVPSSSAGSIPFVDLGGKYMIVGASYNPQVLQGKSHLQIAQAMNNPGSDIAKGADGTANLITATLCKQTHQQPAGVCSSAGVTQAAKALGGS